MDFGLHISHSCLTYWRKVTRFISQSRVRNGPSECLDPPRHRSELISMPLLRGCALVLGLAAFACGSSGAGGDLFSANGGSLGSGSGGKLSSGGGSDEGGAAANDSGGVTSAAGGTPALGGAPSSGAGGTTGGTVTTSGGAPSASGGRSGSAGAPTSGGAGAASGGAGTAGASSGGAPVVTGGTGGTAAGGQVGSGGKPGVSCDTLRTRLESLLTDAQACERAGSGFQQCSDTVMTECGCSVPVNSSSNTAIDDYKMVLAQLKKACPMDPCPKIACQDPTPATCQTTGPGGGGHCAPSNFAAGQGAP